MLAKLKMLPLILSAALLLAEYLAAADRVSEWNTLRDGRENKLQYRVKTGKFQFGQGTRQMNWEFRNLYAVRVSLEARVCHYDEKGKHCEPSGHEIAPGGTVAYGGDYTIGDPERGLEISATSLKLDGDFPAKSVDSQKNQKSKNDVAKPLSTEYHKHLDGSYGSSSTYSHSSVPTTIDFRKQSPSPPGQWSRWSDVKGSGRQAVESHWRTTGKGGCEIEFRASPLVGGGSVLDLTVTADADTMTGPRRVSISETVRQGRLVTTVIAYCIQVNSVVIDGIEIRK